jgi:hypothetical protein
LENTKCVKTRSGADCVVVAWIYVVSIYIKYVPILVYSNVPSKLRGCTAAQ